MSGGNKVHCQCSNSLEPGTPKGNEYCEGTGNPLIHAHGHCDGPHVVDGYRLGDYGVGSAYRTEASVWKLAADGESCTASCNGRCDLATMQELARKRIKDSSVVNVIWAGGAGFSSEQCTKAGNSGSVLAIPLIYPSGDCRTMPDSA